MTQRNRPSSVPANPSKWSEKSQQSVAYGFTREYRDIAYRCWHCQADSVFTAQDQQHTFELRQASIDQRRILCTTCWLESNRIRSALHECEEQWAAAKPQLSVDKPFLSHWLGQLAALETYVPYKPDTAKKNMLSKLLANLSARASPATPAPPPSSPPAR
ncbi:zinc-ribbon domain containing protein [Roseateles sp.]|uniref:zinc-ribbon domain containing protein n=1 Tax=Roseateles sp. TaxID=1971397 RepID=UPI003267925E